MVSEFCVIGRNDEIRKSLNPCFNGIWSRRQETDTPVGYPIFRVLILVLMEYGLGEDLNTHIILYIRKS